MRYSINEQKWKAMSSMEFMRRGLSAVMFNDHIWAIGGYDGRQDLTSVELFNPAQNRLIEPLSFALTSIKL
jgi:hypothetical protein